MLGDVFTYMTFAPLWPLSRRKVALKFFSNSDVRVNRALWMLGMIVTFLYFIFVLLSSACRSLS
ncbi:MAG: hypothetical protein DRJ69_03740 [Thermoprotei archaeon]|nr:MAG: hypothetical protein DRJ69_03740 [Thermoprotei archaeon]